MFLLKTCLGIYHARAEQGHGPMPPIALDLATLSQCQYTYFYNIDRMPIVSFTEAAWLFLEFSMAD